MKSATPINPATHMDSAIRMGSASITMKPTEPEQTIIEEVILDRLHQGPPPSSYCSENDHLTPED